jgi:hypothetical protein
MNIASKRSIISHTLALSVAIGGAWFLAVRPLDARLREVRGRHERLVVQHQSALETLSLDRVSPEEVLSAVQLRSDRIATQCAISGEASSLYASIAEMASSRGMRIDRMEPKRVSLSNRVQSARPARGDRSGSAARAPALQASGYAIEVVDSYGRVAELLGAIERELGVSKVLAFRLTPLRGADGRELVRATIDTAHYYFDAPLGVIASAEGGE